MFEKTREYKCAYAGCGADFSYLQAYRFPINGIDAIQCPTCGRYVYYADGGWNAGLEDSRFDEKRVEPIVRPVAPEPVIEKADEPVTEPEPIIRPVQKVKKIGNIFKKRE